MSNIQNKIAYFVNFNKYKKRICNYNNRASFYIYNKTTLLITLLAKNIVGKFFNQKEKNEMKGENKNNMCYRLTALRQSLVFHKLMSLLSCASTIQQIGNIYL